MTYRLGRNLRSGHIAEDIGVLFLRSFCSVATIRQEDDYGTDAVATLLEPKNGMLYATNSFFVQIKSSSVHKISYSNDEIKWLLNQDLPFFICSVDKYNQRIALYTTNPVFGILIHNNINQVELILDDLPENGLDRIKLVGDAAEVLIGPPIIKASEKYSRTDEFALHAYNLMSEWVVKEFNLMSLRRNGRTEIARWKCWNSPEYYGVISVGSDSNIQRDLELIRPYIEYISQHILNASPEMKYEESLAFLILKRWLNKNGIDVDIDEYRLIEKIKWPKRKDFRA